MFVQPQRSRASRLASRQAVFYPPSFMYQYAAAQPAMNAYNNTFQNNGIAQSGCVNHSKSDCSSMKHNESVHFPQLCDNSSEFSFDDVLPPYQFDYSRPPEYIGIYNRNCNM